MVNGQHGALGLSALQLVVREQEKGVEHVAGLTIHNMVNTVRETQTKRRIVIHNTVQV